MSRGPDAPCRVVWLHNYYSRGIGMFMWDILDNLPEVPWLRVEEQSMPLVKRVGDFVEAVQTGLRLKHDCDLVHAQYGSLTGLVARLSGARYIVSFRGSDIYPHPGSLRQRTTGRIRGAFSYLAARRAAAVVVMSNAMRARVLRWPGLARKRVHILVDPIHLSYWPARDKSLAASIAETRLTVATASLLDANPVKRLEVIKRAQQLCVALGLDVELLQIVGMDRAAVRAAMEQSDVLALASTHEGWPNVVKEALLLDRPFISTDVSDLTAYAERRDKCQIVAPDPVDFAFAFIDALAHKALSGEADFDLTGFHPHVCALKHLALYLEYGARP